MRYRIQAADLAGRDALLHQRIHSEIRFLQGCQRRRVIAADDEDPVRHLVGQTTDFLFGRYDNRRRLVFEHVRAGQAGAAHQAVDERLEELSHVVVAARSGDSRSVRACPARPPRVSRTRHWLRTMLR